MTDGEEAARFARLVRDYLGRPKDGGNALLGRLGSAGMTSEVGRGDWWVGGAVLVGWLRLRTRLLRALFHSQPEEGKAVKGEARGSEQSYTIDEVYRSLFRQVSLSGFDSIS